MSGRRAVLTWLLAWLLTACASIPTAGPVTQGREVNEPRLRYFATGPGAGDEPEEIVAGFLRAAAAAEDNHAVARSFLAGDRRQDWRPNGRVLVHAVGDAVRVRTSPMPATDDSPGQDSASAVQVDLSVELAAVLDDAGRYQGAAPAETVELQLTLEQVQGQWRITALEDGLLLPAADFARFYEPIALYYSDPARSVLVPDVRWFSERDLATATAATEALLAGPSTWLADAVITGAPAGTRLALDSVRVNDRMASVELSNQALLAGPADRQLLRVQLQQTLQQVDDVDVVRVTVEGVDYAPSDRSAPGGRLQLARNPGVPSSPVLLESDRLVRLRGTRIEPVEQVPAFSGRQPSSPALALDESRYALLVDEGSRLLSGRLDQSSAEPVQLLAGVDLTPPSIDRAGWVWSTPAAGTGVVTAAHPPATPPEIDGGEPRLRVAEVQAPGLAGRRIRSLRISRDGARALVVSSGDGQERLEVAGVVRDSAGRPSRLTELLPLAPGMTDMTSAAWVDESTVVVLGRRQGGAVRPFVVTVVGPATATAEVDGASTVTAANGVRAIYVGTSDGRLIARSGGGWVEVATDVEGPLLDPAYPG